MPSIDENLQLHLLQSALDRAALGVALYEGEGFVHVYVNPAFQSLKPRKPMLGRSYAEIWPEVAEAVVPQFAHVFETGEPWVASDAPFEVEREPGVMETAYYTFSVYRLDFAGGRYLLEYARETTADVKARRGELLASLLANMSDAFVTLDSEWRYSYVNDKAVESFRKPREALLGRTLWEVFPGLAGTVFEDRLRLVMDEGASESFEACHPGIDAWYDVRAYPHGDGIAAFYTDVTPRKEAEQRAKRELDTTHLLLEAANTLATTLDMNEILTRLADVALKSTGLTRAFVNRIDTDRQVLIPIVATGGLTAPSGPLIPFDRLSKASMNAILAKKTALLDYELAETPEYDRKIAEANNSRFVLFVPLLVGGEIVGHIALDEPGERHQFSEREIELVEGIASQAAVVVQNARLYEAERDIADRLQEALLTMPLGLAGIEFAHAYHSATEAARVGGDFYDIFELDRHHVGITIGDVAGKGLDAAVLTSLAKNTIRAHAGEKGKTPARILTLTNDVVYRSTPTEAFVTVFFAILDRCDGRLTYANAGHTVAALVTKNGTASKLPVTSPLLGAFEDVEFGESEACLELDELLFLYTDGLTEARRDGEQYGEERLFSRLSSTRWESGRDVVGDVIADVMSFAGNRLRDDLAILAVRRLEAGAGTPTQQKLEL